MYGYPQAITTQQILVPPASNGNGVFQGSNFGPPTTFGIGPSGLPVIIPSGIQPSQTGSGAISGYGSSAGIGTFFAFQKCSKNSNNEIVRETYGNIEKQVEEAYNDSYTMKR